MKVHWYAEAKHLNVGENWVEDDPGFVSLEDGDYHLRADAPVRRLDIADLPLERMGLVEDEYRPIGGSAGI